MVPGVQRPLRRREPPPTVGRDNSATRYEVVKHRMHQLGVRRQRRWENRAFGDGRVHGTVCLVSLLTQTLFVVCSRFSDGPEGWAGEPCARRRG